MTNWSPTARASISRWLPGNDTRLRDDRRRLDLSHNKQRTGCSTMSHPPSQGLAPFAARVGAPTASAANTPIRLDGEAAAWFVEQGALDVFYYEQEGGDIAAAAKHLLRAEEGRLVFGTPRLDGPVMLVAKGLADTRLLRIEAARLHELANGAGAAESGISTGGTVRGELSELARQADQWITDFADAVTADFEYRPPSTALIDAQDAVTVTLDSVISARRPDVMWACSPTAETGFDLAYLGTETLPVDDEHRLRAMALTADSWATVIAGAHSERFTSSAPEDVIRLHITTSVHLADEGRLLGALDDFARLAMRAEVLNRRLRLADEVNAQTARAAHRRMARERARTMLDSVSAPRQRSAVTPTPGSDLMAALERIGRHSGIEFTEPRRPATAPPLTLEEVVEASGLRARRVRLAPEDRWWSSDSGALLGYRQDTGESVALLPGLRGYRAIGADGRARRVSADSAGQWSNTAWALYPKLRDDRPIAVRDLLRVARRGAGVDLTRFVVAGLLTALLAQAPAIALASLTDWALPFARADAVAAILLTLGVLGVAGTVLAVFGGAMTMRVEARVGARLSAAAWDRLLALPLPFFRDTIAGELAVRMATFQHLRDLVSGAVASVVASTVFLLPTLGVLYLYDTVLATTAVAMTALALAVTVGLGLAQIPHQRRWHAEVRTLSGRLFQFIGGIAKIRACGAESAVFASWAEAYRNKQLAEVRGSRINEHLAAFGAAFPFGFAALLCAVAISRGDGISAGDFVVVLTASFTLYAAVAGLGRAIDSLAEAFTSYEQIAPVLAAVPERGDATLIPVRIEGDVVVDQVSFRYAPDAPLVLDKVTVSARRGEFVAIVGASGSGKSTLVRLLLGLEMPELGAVYFDDRDLRHLDVGSVRRQIGVVPQECALQPGSLAENIIGMAEDLTLDDAWTAARLAALDTDIAEMPMQMMTQVGDRASIFSGGQVQRIRIAAALVRNPRILIFDEATSWLDAPSQAKVMGGIERLDITRIVIAHRLSTIRQAGRIYVLDSGQVAQVGGFDELLAASGPFRELVQRQLL